MAGPRRGGKGHSSLYEVDAYGLREVLRFYGYEPGSAVHSDVGAGVSPSHTPKGFVDGSGRYINY